ncbi:MAG: membrane protein insertase YidC [Proteobacteria bacterium]|nr:membrane protein insertase YidC [Pseudomonadota bacterium]
MSNNSILPNNPRVYLWVGLAALLALNVQYWMHDFAPALNAPTGTTAGAPAPATPDLSSSVPQAATGSAGAPSVVAPAVPAPGEAGPEAAAAAGAPVVHVHTDVLDLDISTRGGTLARVDLTQYPQVKGEAAPVRLENGDPATLYELQSGLTGAGSGPYPNHLALYSAERTDYALGDAQELKVPLTWSEGGVTVTKTFVFRRGQYSIGLDYSVHNGGAAALEIRPYAQILRNDPRTKSSYLHVETYAFHGPALYDGTKYRKLDPTSSDDARLSLEVKDGWMAALQHHFVSAIVPPAGAPWHFALTVSGNQYLLSGTGPELAVAPGATADLAQSLYAGPKLQSQLAVLSPELGRVADYGRLWILARPLFWLLDKVHGVTGNWGLAIILVTFLLKLLFYPLSEASGRSMAKMKTLQPRIKNLQETYKDDREKLGRAMMELYQREKVNPVAGCLPIVIQIPVFIAFYWVLLESVEMRQAPFMGWIHDLSSRDPLFVLPAIMAVAMFVQYKLNPAPPDPVQAKVFMIMPLAMSVMFAFFPAGLVLYWVTNTCLSIAQQWNINRRIEAAAAARRAS